MHVANVQKDIPLRKFPEKAWHEGPNEHKDSVFLQFPSYFCMCYDVFLVLTPYYQEGRPTMFGRSMARSSRGPLFATMAAEPQLVPAPRVLDISKLLARHLWASCGRVNPCQTRTNAAHRSPAGTC